jgi:hypothetical protein
LKGIRKARIIQDVYFVTDYIIHVTIGDKNITECSETRRTPIAFTFKKYALASSGMLGTPERVDVKDIKIKKLFWIEKKGFRSPNDPLPNIPSACLVTRNPPFLVPALFERWN